MSFLQSAGPYAGQIWSTFSEWLNRALNLLTWVVGAFIVLSLIVCGIAAVLGLVGNTHPDRKGDMVWASFHVTPVFIDGDWLVGEYRECAMLRYQQPEVSGTQAGAYSSPLLFCYFGAQIGSSTRNANPPSCVRGEQTSAMLDLMNGALPSQAHELSVKYFGDWERTSKSCILWQCRRDEKSLTCHVLG